MEQENRVADFDVSVQRTEKGWQVIVTADGVQEVLEPVYADQDAARFAASNIESGARRWSNAADVEPEPE